MATTGSQVRGVGIIGAGRVSAEHAGAVANMDNLQLLAVAEPDDERRAQFAADHHCNGYADHQKLLDRQDVDLVLVGVPNWLHAPLVIDAIKAGKHVLVEKPMAMTTQECNAMIDAAKQHGVQLMVGHTQHFFPANVAAKTLIDRGDIGPIVMATATWYKPFGLPFRAPWFLDRPQGGGMWMMNGSHMIDCLLWFIGAPLKAVKGSVTNKIFGLNADDSSIAILQFENDIYATIVHCGSKRPEQPPPEQWLTIEVTGVEGALKVVSYEGLLSLNLDGNYKSVDVTPQDGMTAEIGAFVRAIETGAPPPITNEFSRSIIEALLAVEQSSDTGREVLLR